MTGPNDIPLAGEAAPNAFEKFLGSAAGIQDPVALLGLSAQDLTEASIIASLQRQLTRVGASSDALSPEADEVRLALHAAAARLLDPTTRRQIQSGAGVPSRPPAAAAASTDPSEVPVEAAMLLTMGAMGGWNRRSMHRMAQIARSYGLPPDQAMSTIRGLMDHPVAPPKPLPGAGPLSSPRQTASAPKQASMGSLPLAGAPRQSALFADDPFAPSPEEVDPAHRIVKAVLVFGGFGVVGVGAIIVLLVAVLSGPKPAPSTPNTPSPPIATNTPATSEHQLFPTRPKDTATKPQPIGVAQTRVGDWNDLLRAMSACVAGLDIDAAAAADRFESVYADMANKWGEASPDGVVAGVDRIVEFVFHASTHPDLSPRVVGLIVDGAFPLHSGGALTASQVATAPWSTGVLARLSRERDLPASVRHRVQDALSEAFPGSSGPSDTTFRAGAIAALSAMPPRLTSPTGKPDPKRTQDTWKTWLAALSALDGKQSPLFTRSTLIALDYLLVSAPEPTQDRSIFDAIGILTVALPWRKEDESRRWLLRWFDSPAVTAGDLYALTAALATQSGAEGVDSSMVLSTGAGESQRAELRDRYASVWGLSAGQTRDALVQQWAKVARESLAAEPTEDTKTPVGALERSVTMARLNQAAAMLWSGDTGLVPDLLEPYHRPNAAVIPNAPAVYQFQTRVTLLTFGGGGLNNDWLVKYCAAGHNIPVRRELLSQLKRAPEPAEADILVQEACRGTPAQLRADARAIVLNYKDNAAVINSMLEFAPVVPITTENNDLIAQIATANLPSIKDPTWRVAVRRSLVERLAEVLAGQGEFAKVDDLADALAAAYTEVRPKPSDSEAAPAPALITARKAAAQPLELAAMSLRGRWQREADLLVASGREPLSLAQVESRRSARLRLAVGRIQDFAAEQVNICELMSYVVTSEQPGRAETTAAALSVLSSARQTSKHIFEQIESGERARVRLWLARFGESQS